MIPFDTPLLAVACRIFLEAAYGDGPRRLPPASARYADPLTEGPPEPWWESDGVYQALPQGGFTLRLGSATYPHLKLRVQTMRTATAKLSVFAVDTHDSFSNHDIQPPAGHPEATAWQVLQETNRTLKERIEAAWEAAGLPTLNGLLRQALASRPAAPE